MTTAGLGYVAWWGYSPALDLINLTGDCICIHCMTYNVLLLIHTIILLCFSFLGLDNAVKLKNEHVKQGTMCKLQLYYNTRKYWVIFLCHMHIAIFTIHYSALPNTFTGTKVMPCYGAFDKAIDRQSS